MPHFGRQTPPPRSTPRRATRRRFFRKDKDRVAGGYKAALTNPHTTREGRKHAKRELRLMGRGEDTHVPFMAKVKRALGIRSTPQSHTSTRHVRF